MTSRNGLLARIHIAKKDLCLDDDAYQDCLMAATGKDSAAVMTLTQLHQALDHFKSKGWKAKKKKSFRRSSKNADVRLIYALWWDLHAKGKLDCDKSQLRAALQKFVVRMTGIENPEWISGDEARKVIEALKAMKNRKEK